MVVPSRIYCKPGYNYLVIGIIILVLAVFPVIMFAQTDPEPAQTPASIFSKIKAQFKKDIKTVRNVTKEEGKEIADRTKTESADIRKTATGLKTRPDLGAPETALSDP